MIASTKTVPSRPPLLLCALCDLGVENSPILLHPTARMLSLFPATLTRNQHFCRKMPPVSPLPATLTDAPSRKSFPCHSYENMGGVSLSLLTRHQPLASKFFRINTCKTVSKQTTLTLFRINTYKKPGGGGLLLTKYLARIFVPRSAATRDLSSLR